MSRLDINHVGPDKACSVVRAFILSRLDINHVGPDKTFSAVRALI